MRNVLDNIHHHGNALHVYSWLCRFVNSSTARRIARQYEKFFHPVLYTVTSRRGKG